MRSAILLGLFAAAFLYLVLDPHRRARAIARGERQALARIETLFREGRREELEEGGYRFRWILGSGLPDLLVAEPGRYGEDGVRTFACSPAPALFERDPVLRPSRPDPEETRLRTWLALTDEERRDSSIPWPWRPVGR